MKATAIESRYHVLVIVLIYLVGFLAPWEPARPAASRHLWSWLAMQLANHLQPQPAFLLIAVLACALASVGAGLQVWGSACLDRAVASDQATQTDRVVRFGPYSYPRYRLFGGAWLTGAAIAILMPPTGAIFFLLALAVFEWRLAGMSETAPTTGGTPDPRSRWKLGILAESYSIGVALCFAFFSWKYDVHLLTRGVVVSFGTSILVQAFLPRRRGMDRLFE